MANAYIENYVDCVKASGGILTKKPVTLSGTSANLAVGGNLTVTGTISGGSESTTSQVITAVSANAFSVGANGTTNPSFNIDTSVASTATGINIQGQAAGGGVIVSAISSGTNESIFTRPKGNGGFRIQAASTVALQVAPVAGGGPNFVVNNNAVTSATGIQVVAAAAGGGVAVSAISTGTDESVTFGGKGAGTVTFQSAVVASAGGSAADGVMFGSLSVGLFTGTGTPTFSAMNGSIYVDSNATTTTTRIYVNKSGAGTAGTTWTNLTTAA